MNKFKNQKNKQNKNIMILMNFYNSSRPQKILITIKFKNQRIKLIKKKKIVMIYKKNMRTQNKNMKNKLNFKEKK